MKKLFALIAVLAMTFSFVACSNTEPSSSETPSESEASVSEEESESESESESEEEVAEKTWDKDELENILDDIVASTEFADADYQGMVVDSTSAVEITEDMEEYHMGSTEYTFERAVVREPMMSSQAFSLMLINTATAEDAQAIADEIGGTVDPMKWVCVCVEEDDVKVATKDNLVFVVMAQDSQNFIDAFDAVTSE